jgi:hypothetical protein
MLVLQDFYCFDTKNEKSKQAADFPYHDNYGFVLQVDNCGWRPISLSVFEEREK